MDTEVKIEKVQIKEEVVDLGEEFVVDSTLRGHVKTEITEPTNTKSSNNVELTDANVDIGCAFNSLALKGEHVCSDCGRSYSSQNELYNHVILDCEEQSQNGEESCPFCSFSSDTMIDMNSHIMLKHRVSLDPLATEIQTNEKKKGLQQHDLPKNNEMIEDRPVCKPCGNSFKTQQNLRRHVKYCDKINSDVQKFKCPYCPLETKYKRSLSSHLRSMHSNREIDLHVCKDCGRSFKHKKYLTAHAKLCGKKTEEMVKFKCSHCSYETLYKSSLRRHIAGKHPIDSLGYKVCKGCQKSFASTEGWQKHMKCCEQINTAPVKYKCPHCSHETKRKWDLPQHIARIHLSMGRQVCSQCGKSYKNMISLEKHLKYHCDKTFERKY